MPIVLDAASPEEIPALVEQIVRQVVAQFGELQYRQPLREEVVPLLVAEHEEYFNREAGPLGNWQPLSPVTVKKKGFDTILIETNRMRSSLLFDGPDHIEDVEDRFLTWGTSDPKAHIHQEGTARIPQRAFVGVSEETADAIADKIADHVVKLLKG